MYLSDYLYASGYNSSTNTTTPADSYYGNKNWLYKGWEWTQTPYASGADFTWSVEGGRANPDYALNPNGWRPTFYLKSSVYVTGGDGSFDNPYTIACDNCTE